MNTQDNNKLIAEFMGYKLMPCNHGKAWDIGKSIPSKDHVFPIQGVLHTGNELKFNSSWDWLMPVVEKCMQAGDNTNEWDALYDALSTINITNTHNAVVEFINQYNTEQLQEWARVNLLPQENADTRLRFAEGIEDYDEDYIKEMYNAKNK